VGWLVIRPIRVRPDPALNGSIYWGRSKGISTEIHEGWPARMVPDREADSVFEVGKGLTIKIAVNGDR
jgi:hypothetical protein